MKVIKFKEVNGTYAKNQPEYIPLPVFNKYNLEGEVVCCWSLSLKERVKILFTGKLWVSLLTFYKNLQPIRPTVNKKDLITGIESQ